MIDERTKEGKLHRGPSLTIKWAFASSLFIFVIFTLFAVTTYKSALDLIVAKEKENMEQTISEVTGRLSRGTEDLTILTTIDYLQSGTYTSSSSSNKTKDAIVSNLMQLDPFISEISQKDLYIYIYNHEKEMVFSTKSRSSDLLGTSDQPIQIVGIDQKTGFLLIKEIKSQQTGEVIGYVQAFYQLKSYYEIRSQLLVILLILELISLLFSSVLAFFLASYFLKPIAILRDTMLRVRNDPQAKVYSEKIMTNDELEDLSEIFNEMMQEIRNYISLQEQFVSDVSHELRTPVAIVEGHLSMLNRWGKNEPEILDEGISASLHEIQRMKSLIQEMLTLSRAGSIDPALKHEVSNAPLIVEKVVNNFKFLSPEFQLNFANNMQTTQGAKIFHEHLEQITIIILENAIKYSTDKFQVDITLSNNEKYFVLSIRDYGEGMEQEEADKIFGRFYRVDKARARKTGGNGLGLAIAAQLVENYKGKIKVKSKANVGSDFIIYIPLEKQDS